MISRLRGVQVGTTVISLHKQGGLQYRRFAPSAAVGLVAVWILVLLVSGCATAPRQDTEPAGLPTGPTNVSVRPWLAPDLAKEVLALDPERVSEAQVKEVLSRVPAPRIVNIHGGIYPVHLAMVSFSEFLAGMGYPRSKIARPGDGAYSFSCYESSRKIAGAIAWYYEHEGMRPMIVGHSQGGMQAVKVLYQLAGLYREKVPVWNPLTGRTEKRYEIHDPFTGRLRPVVGVQVCYTTAVGAGGLTRFLPNQWDMAGRLRGIPDSTEEFTGFYMGLDFFGGDLLGFGGANAYRALGRARVRNVQLPTGYDHVTVPAARHLLESQAIKDWINDYQPTDKPRRDTRLEGNTAHILWAADVWHSIKKHWVLEAQRWAQASARETNAMMTSGQDR